MGADVLIGNDDAQVFVSSALEVGTGLLQSLQASY